MATILEKNVKGQQVLTAFRIIRNAITSAIGNLVSWGDVTHSKVTGADSVTQGKVYSAKAVNDIVDAAIAEVPVADTDKGLQVETVSGGTDKLQVKLDSKGSSAIKFRVDNETDPNTGVVYQKGEIYVQDATDRSKGVVTLATNIDSDAYANNVPTAGQVKSYVDETVGDAIDDLTLTPGTGIDISGKTVTNKAASTDERGGIRVYATLTPSDLVTAAKYTKKGTAVASGGDELQIRIGQQITQQDAQAQDFSPLNYVGLCAPVGDDFIVSQGGFSISKASTVSAGSSSIPTSAAVASYVAGQISGANLCMGEINSQSELTAAAPYTIGMYWYVGTAGTYLTHVVDGEIVGEDFEAGDIIYCRETTSTYDYTCFSGSQRNIEYLTDTEVETLWNQAAVISGS